MSQPLNPFEAPTVDARPLAARPSGLATPNQRIRGAVIDGLATFGPLIVLVPLSGLLATAAARTGIGAFEIALPVAVLWMFGFTVWQWRQVALTGQTLGKRVVGTRIVRQDGTPCGFLHGVLLRTVVFQVVSGVLQVVLVGYVVAFVDALMLLRDDRRTLHDHLAGTRVVRA